MFSTTFMNRTLGAAVLSAGALMASPAAIAADPQVAGEVVVKIRSGESVYSVVGSHGVTIVDQFGSRPIYRLQITDGRSVASAVDSLKRDARVEFAEPNFVGHTPEARRRVAVWAVGGSSSQAANQWASYAINLSAAHSITRGYGVRVAVIDTGIDMTHPAFAGKLVSGFDFVDFDSDPSELGTVADAGFGHGTHVAGLVNLVAPQAKIMPIRALDQYGASNLWVLAEAIMYAVDPDGNPNTDDGAHVINLSVGTTQPTRLLNTAIELATCSDDDDDEDGDDYSDAGFASDKARCDLRYGTVVIAAAGNGSSATEKQYPAAEHAEGALAVTASTQSGQVAGFANYGTWVQIAAPGENIISTVPGGYGTWSGTSMATPMVAGAAALVKAANRDWKPIDVTKRLIDRSKYICSPGLPLLDVGASVHDFTPSSSCR
jgi:subtilisin family serine protease